MAKGAKFVERRKGAGLAPRVGAQGRVDPKSDPPVSRGGDPFSLSRRQSLKRHRKTGEPDS